jgi:hypothetical protein
MELPETVWSKMMVKKNQIRSDCFSKIDSVSQAVGHENLLANLLSQLLKLEFFAYYENSGQTHLAQKLTIERCPPL